MIIVIFPAPDLLPIEIDDAMIEAIRQDLPELPEQKQQRFIHQYKLSNYDADLLTGDRFMADFYEDTVKHSDDAKLSANWVLGEISATLNKHESSIQQSPVSAKGTGLAYSPN